MSFLGPVTTLDGHLVRPHDLEIETHPFGEAYPGRIERFNRVGFEVRLDVRLTEDDAAPPVLVTLTRADATAKGLETGMPVWLTPVAGASQVRISTPVAYRARQPRPLDSSPTSPRGAATYFHLQRAGLLCRPSETSPLL